MRNMRKEQWIGVNEWLPMISPTKYNSTWNKILLSNNVLVFHGMISIAYLKFSNDEFSWIIANEGFEISNVTHWMYLPEEPTAS